MVHSVTKYANITHAFFISKRGKAHGIAYTYM